MHNCKIVINNESYTPVRALPLCTSGQFTPADVMCLLTDPESHSDSSFSCNVLPYHISAENTLTYLPSGSMLRFKDNVDTVIAKGGNTTEQLAAMPCNVFVKTTEMQSINAFIEKTTQNNQSIWSKTAPHNFEWTDSPYITAQEKSIIFDGIDGKLLSNPKLRINDATTKRKKIQEAFEKIRHICAAKNIEFSSTHIPGQKKQLYECVKIICPTIGISLETFSGKDYAGHLGYKWAQGERTIKGNYMVEAVKEQMGVV